MEPVKPRLVIFTALFVGLISVGLISVGLVLYIYAESAGIRPEQAGRIPEITSEQAYAMWRVDPDSVNILDVRTTAEYALVGHPPMAHNIPIATWTGRFDSSRRTYAMQNNPDFMRRVEERFSRKKTILLLCRSGNRSGVAAELLSRVGYNRVYNISDGFEGVPAVNGNGLLKGRAVTGGWKFSGAPWTYELDPERIYSP